NSARPTAATPSSILTQILPLTTTQTTLGGRAGAITADRGRSSNARSSASFAATYEQRVAVSHHPARHGNPAGDRTISFSHRRIGAAHCRWLAARPRQPPA